MVTGRRRSSRRRSCRSGPAGPRGSSGTPPGERTVAAWGCPEGWQEPSRRPLERDQSDLPPFSPFSGLFELPPGRFSGRSAAPGAVPGQCRRCPDQRPWARCNIVPSASASTRSSSRSADSPLMACTARKSNRCSLSKSIAISILLVPL